jgi:hypothetical protein
MTGSVKVYHDLQQLMQRITVQQGVEPGTPLALKMAEVLSQAQQNARLSRRQCVQRLTRLRTVRATLGRLLLTMLADGGPRTEPPLPLHERRAIAAGCRAWSPWTGLAPPAVPQFVQRQ